MEEKKESWLEKVLSLLNEFETPHSWIVFKSYDDYDGTFYWVDIDGETEIAWSDSFVCGKRFWWIKWLVENDKIERRNYWNIYISDYCDDDIYLAYEKWEQWILHQYELEDTLLMLLSISDTPISDLISYLK